MASVPYTFAPNTTIMSSEANANFAALGIGVTNGADATQGQVGEYVLFSQQLSVPAGAATQGVSLGTLQPGDWDLLSWGSVAGAVTALSFSLAAPVAGISGNLSAAFAGDPANPPYTVTLVGQPARALTSTAASLVFTVTINSPTQQTMTIQVSGRRMR